MSFHMSARDRLALALAPRYVIERELGHGGMATVFLARDAKYGRQVAVKLLDAGVRRAVDAARFLQEIRTTANLSHPHILPLYDSGEADGLLYYIMRYVAGESLRDRLVREGRLPVTEAIRIAIDVADALACAHDHGVVHRDVKPENILLGDGVHVYVADFGVARALEPEGDRRLTSKGLIGSPAYMSPEQIEGTAELDGRADIYSLGCVLFELLAARPPFEARSAPALFVLHLTARPPSLSVLRADVPIFVATAVDRALRKSPQARFRGAAEFCRALRGERDGKWARRLVATLFDPRSLRAAAVVGAVLLGAAGIRLAGGGWLFGAGAAALDTAAFAIVVPGPERDPAAHRLAGAVHGALSDWRGVRAVEWRLPAGASAPSRALQADVVELAAKESNAAFVVALALQDIGTGWIATATRYDARLPRSPPRQVMALLDAPGNHVTDRSIAELADSLIFASPPRWSFGLHAGGTKITAARAAFDDAARALAAWDLARADSAFAAAVVHDPQYAPAHLWLAHVRHWSDQPAERWSVPLGQAMRLADMLRGADRTRAAALDDLSKRSFPSACARYDSLLAADRRDFVSWYGAAECRRLDNLVVRSNTSDSRWAFRSSYHAAVLAYQRAFEIEPGMVKCFSQGAYDALRNRLFTSSVRIRSGTNTAGERFVAYPDWQDTIVFVPYSQGEFERSVAHRAPPGQAVAVSRLRAVFDLITARWATAAPRDAEALFARGVALEFTDPDRALAVYRDARALAVSPEQRLRGGVAEFWLRVKLAMPSHPSALASARTLADSLLQEGASLAPDRVWFLASVAGLVGRVDEAADYAEHGAVARSTSLPSNPEVARLSGRALVFAAFGHADALAGVEREIRLAVDGAFPENERLTALRGALARALMLGAPLHHSALIAEILDPRMPVALLLSGDPAAARRAVTMQDGAYRRRAACDVTLDALYVDSWVMSRVGLAAKAAERLDQTLRVLRFCEPQLLGDVAIAGALRQAIELRRQLALDSGDDATAGEWETALRALDASRDRS
jgi:tRNA A-37 threonylcarbamoyl transferase component Bud32